MLGHFSSVSDLAKHVDDRILNSKSIETFQLMWDHVDSDKFFRDNAI